MLHLVWVCPAIVPFCKDIRDQIKEVLGLNIPFSPVHFLLHVPPVPIRLFKKSVLPHLLNAVKRLLPIHWKRKQVPTQGGVGVQRE